MKWLLLIIPLSILANIEEPHVVLGGAEFHQVSPTHLEITTQNATIIDCKRFNIPENHTVKINQPNSKSRMLARVRGSDPTEIFGKLESSGKVFLINPNGIFFGPNCTVNTGSLIASTLDIANDDFKKGHFRFKLSSEAKGSQIMNKGVLTAGPGGEIVLIAPHIINEGVINARAEKVAFLGSEIVTLDLTGDHLISFALEGELEQGAITHLGKIACEEGSIYMRLSVAKKAIEMVVNKDGFEEGRALIRDNGVVRIASKSEILAKNISLQGTDVEIAGNVKSTSLLEAVASRIEISEQLTMKSQIILTGETHLASKITASQNNITFNGATIVHGPDCSVSTSFGKGDVRFKGPVDGEGSYSGLKVSAGGGDVIFSHPIGKTSSLDSLSVTAKSIEINDVGGDQIGVRNLAIKASDHIHMKGRIYHAGEHLWDGQRFHVYNPIKFISNGHQMEFARGTVSLKEGASFHVNTHGGNFNFFAIEAGKKADITFNTGALVLGEILAPHSSLNILAETIAVKGNVTVNQVTMEAQGDIFSELESHKIISKCDATLVSRDGSIGYRDDDMSLSESRLHVESDQKIYVGSPKTVNLEGSSIDKILHPIPGNEPVMMTFNDMEFYHFRGDYYEDIEELLSSLAPHLFSKKRGDYIDTTIVNPMPPLLYYRP